MKRLLLGLAFSLAISTAAAAQTVIVVRHAEKADQSSDPVLSMPGIERAWDLAHTLEGAGLTHVFATPLQRTQLTASRAASAAGLEVVPISLEGGGATHINRVVEAVRALPADSVVLVVGHSNTVPEIIKGLGGISEAMTDCEYDRLSVLTLDGETAHVVRGRYGDRTEPCEAQ